MRFAECQTPHLMQGHLPTSHESLNSAHQYFIFGFCVKAVEDGEACVALASPLFGNLVCIISYYSG